MAPKKKKKTRAKRSSKTTASAPDAPEFDPMEVTRAHGERMAAKPVVRFLRAPNPAALYLDAVAQKLASVHGLDEAGLIVTNPDLLVGPATNEEMRRAAHDAEHVIGPASIGEVIAAHKAVGEPMAPVPPALAARAAELRNLLTVVAGASEAPVRLIADAHRVIEQWLSRDEQAEPWMRTLDAIFLAPLPSDPAVRLDYVLRKLRDSAPSRPTAFDAPTPAMLERARVAIAPLRIARPGRTAAGLTSSWSAVQRFAAAFGLHVARRDDAMRKPKTRRKRTPPR